MPKPLKNKAVIQAIYRMKSSKIQSIKILNNLP